MDLTAFIFVALVVAWAVYLIPQARRHHDEVSSSRSVDRFSSAMRVLSRQESAESRVVVTPARASVAPVVTAQAQASDAPVESPESPVTATNPARTSSRRPSAAQIRARRAAAKRATQRRRRVLGTVVTLNVIVAALAAFGVIGWVWQAAPATLLVAWLITCRVMVRSEQAAPIRIRIPRPVESAASTASTASVEDAEVPAEIVVERNEQGFDEVGSDADTSTIPAVREPLWDPVPTTLPTYVTKPVATRRTVRTIDLSAPGTWTSGRTEESSAVAREADHAERDAKVSARQRREQRRTGS